MEAKLCPTSDTIYAIASLSKAFTAFIVADIVQDIILEWAGPIRSNFLEF